MSVLNSKDIEYKSYVLSDMKVIELLISFRYKYDSYLFTGLTGSSLEVSGVLPLSEEMIITFASLDSYIEKCNFNEQQMKIIKLVEQGYNNQEIASMIGVNQSTIKGRLKTIYRRISKENEWQWRKSVYTNTLGLKSKRCSKCEEELPATPEFYRDDSRKKDGFQSRCRLCEN